MGWCRRTIAGAATAFWLAGLALPGPAVAERGDSSCKAPSSDASEPVTELLLNAVEDGVGVITELRCRAGSLSHIALQAEPGQRAEIALLLANAGLDAVLVGDGLLTDEAWSSDWVHLEMFSVRVPPGGFLPVSLVLSVPSDFSPGSRHQHHFELVDGEHSLSLTVTLEVIEEQPMFRDSFEIDPVPGQFSYREVSDFNSSS